MRRRKQLDRVSGNNEEDADDQDLIKTEDDTNADFGMQDDIDEDHIMEDINGDPFDCVDDRSSSPVFVPHSRQTSPETIMYPKNDRENLSEINSEDFSEIDNDRRITTRSPTRLDSPELKLEPKSEPDSEYQYLRPSRTHDLIYLTGDSDESTGGGSRITEVIDLTEDSEPNRNGIRYETIDLTRDSDTSQRPMDIIELDD
jgi:hypothetical protein